MRLFRRGRSESGAADDFWSWWSSGRDRVAEAIAAGDFDDRLIGDISRAVRTIHPRMAWELGEGRSSAHAFCLSPEGDPEVRQHALRWLGTAPPPDDAWEYSASRLRAPEPGGHNLIVDGVTFDLDEMRAITSWDTARRRVDVRLWHPLFPEAGEDIALKAGFLFLDNLLGEDDVERWIGQIDLLEAPTGGRNPAELRAEVERRSAEPGADDSWILAERTDRSGAVDFVVADGALKRIDHPFADHHVEIAVLFGADRLPNDAESKFLNAEEDDLADRLQGVATIAAHVTGFGHRTMHFVAEDPDAMRPAIDAWAAALPDALSEGLPQRRIKVNFERDMDWEFQRDLGVR